MILLRAWGLSQHWKKKRIMHSPTAIIAWAADLACSGMRHGRSEAAGIISCGIIISWKIKRTFSFRVSTFQESSKVRCACNPKHLRTPTFPGHEQPSNDIFESQDPTACTRLRLVAAPTAARLTSNLSYCHDPDGNEDASKAFRNCILRIEKLMDHIKSTGMCERVCVFPEALTTGQLSCRKVSFVASKMHSSLQATVLCSSLVSCTILNLDEFGKIQSKMPAWTCLNIWKSVRSLKILVFWRLVSKCM